MTDNESIDAANLKLNPKVVKTYDETAHFKQGNKDEPLIDTLQN